MASTERRCEVKKKQKEIVRPKSYWIAFELHRLYFEMQRLPCVKYAENEGILQWMLENAAAGYDFRNNSIFEYSEFCAEQNRQAAARAQHYVDVDKQIDANLAGIKSTLAELTSQEKVFEEALAAKPAESPSANLLALAEHILQVAATNPGEPVGNTIACYFAKRQLRELTASNLSPQS